MTERFKELHKNKEYYRLQLIKREQENSLEMNLEFCKENRRVIAEFRALICEIQLEQDKIAKIEREKNRISRGGNDSLKSALILALKK